MVAVVPDVKLVKAKRTKLFCTTRAFVADNLTGFLAYQQHMPFHVGFNNVFLDLVTVVKSHTRRVVMFGTKASRARILPRRR